VCVARVHTRATLGRHDEGGSGPRGSASEEGSRRMGTRGGEGSESARARKGTGARDFFCFPSGTERANERESARERDSEP